MILVGVNVLFAILADALFRDKYKEASVPIFIIVCCILYAGVCENNSLPASLRPATQQ